MFRTKPIPPFIQTICSFIGESGCLFLCYLYWSSPKKLLNVISEYHKALSHKHIEKDCTVLAGERIVGCAISKTPYFPNDYAIANYSYTADNGKEYNHWVVVDPHHTIIFNTLQDSKCILYGTPTDYRVPAKKFHDFPIVT